MITAIRNNGTVTRATTNDPTGDALDLMRSLRVRGIDATMTDGEYVVTVQWTEPHPTLTFLRSFPFIAVFDRIES